MARHLLVFCSLPALAACSDADIPQGTQEAEGMSAEQARLVGVNAGEPLAGPRGAGEEPVLEAIGPDHTAELGPTLGGCAFTRQGETLFIAGAPDEENARGCGVVQIGGLERVLVSEQSGGPDYINAGPTMTDGEFTVAVRRAGSGLAIGLDSTQWPADLAIRQGVESERLYKRGTWTCGV